MQFEIERTCAPYREAEQGFMLLERDARFSVLLAACLYARFLIRVT